MRVIELRDLSQARLFLLQGLCLQRAVLPAAPTVRPALEWALELASAGHPLPPTGFVADAGHAAFGADRSARGDRDAVALPRVPPSLPRVYEDHVLGKLYADWSFERAADALRRYKGRDRARGLAYVINQFRERAGFDGVLLPPGVIRAALEAPPEESLTAGWRSLEDPGPLPLLLEAYQSLVAAARRTAEVLGPEDLFELEHGTALAELGQRVALRQVLRAADGLERLLPAHKVRPLAGRREVPTRVLDEDTYPVGGYSSIATRGSVESMLHSQLAFIEPAEKIDLFTVKFVRDELYYYSRDENQFLRRRRAFVFALHPDLVAGRFKDPELPVQRLVMALGLLTAAVRKLTEWLSADALHFEFLFVAGEEGAQPLAQERDLLGMVLREPMASGVVSLGVVAEGDLPAELARRSRRSLCHLVNVSAQDRPLDADDAVVCRLVVDGPTPGLGLGNDKPRRDESDDAVAAWAAALETLLRVAV